MPLVYSEEINAALKEARGVQPHNGKLRVQFKTPDRGFLRKSIGLAINVENIKIGKRILEDINNDIQNRLYQNDPEYFWNKHFPTNSESQTHNITVRQCFVEFEEENSGGISDSVSDKLKSCINWLDHYRLADKPIKSLDKETLDKIRLRTVSGNKEVHFSGCAVTTIKEYTLSLNKVLVHAKEKGYIKINPVRSLKELPTDDYGKEKQDDDVRPFEQEELDSLLAVIHIPQTKLKVQMLAWTGMRHGELNCLAWEDVNFESNQIHVKYNITRKGNVKLTKTEAGIRKIDMLPAAREVLLTMKEKTFDLEPRLEVINYKNKKTDRIMRRRVFLSRGNQPYKRPDLTSKNKQWATWLAKANLKYRPAYQLRHTFASRLLMVGAKPMWLARQMGHKDFSMISKIYAKWIPGQDPDYVHMLAEKLGQTKKDPNE